MIQIEGVVPALGKALADRGYTQLTPVQEAVVGSELGHADALVSAQTGSGKTVAFGLALGASLLEGQDKLGRSGTPLALIVAPTRELALQIKRELTWLYAETGAVIASCVGGMDMRTERQALARGCHLVVGTPGRLRDHLQRESLKTSALRAVVLDEADEMLDLGFREDLEFILENTPGERRTLLFSATVPPTIAQMAKRYQRDAVRIETAGEAKQHLDITYRALHVASGEKENAIINVLRFYEAKNALVFCNTRAGVNHMTARLNNRGFSVVALSGELSQGERTQALQSMRDGRARVCIATDVAARGIDLPNLDLVVHADLPTNPETLLHRSGRTGRAGRKGVSALMVLASGRSRAERLLWSAKIDAAWGAPPSADEVMRKDDDRLLARAGLAEPLQPSEQTIVEKLLAQQSAEEVALAFVRLFRAGQSSPEELTVVDPGKRGERRSSTTRERDRGERNGTDRGAGKARQRGFSESVWYSLSVGRKQNAEPRWLIPMMCKSAGITKSDIGSIKMHGTETHVELNAACVETFQAALGANGKLEKNIRAMRLEGVPTGPVASPRSVAPRGGKPETARPKRKPTTRDQRPPRDDKRSSERRTPQGKPPAQRKVAIKKPSTSDPAEPVAKEVPPATPEAAPPAPAPVKTGPNRKERRLAKFGPPRSAPSPAKTDAAPAPSSGLTSASSDVESTGGAEQAVAKVVRKTKTAASSNPNAPLKRKKSD